MKKAFLAWMALAFLIGILTGYVVTRQKAASGVLADTSNALEFASILKAELEKLDAAGLRAPSEITELDAPVRDHPWYKGNGRRVIYLACGQNVLIRIVTLDGHLISVEKGQPLLWPDGAGGVSSKESG